MSVIPKYIDDINALLDKAFDILDRDSILAFEYIEEALSLSNEHCYSEGIAKSKLRFIQTLVFQGAYSDAVEEASFNMKYLGDNLSNDYDIAELWRYLGSSYSYLNSYSEAIEYINKAKEVYEKIASTKGVLKCLEAMAGIHGRQHHFSKAFEKYKLSLELKKDVSLPKYSLAKTLENIGNIFIELEDFEKSSRYYREARRLLKGGEASDNQICINLMNTGVSNGRLGDFEEANNCFIAAYDLVKKNSYIGIEAILLSNMCEFKFYENKLEEGIELANKGLSLCEKLNLKNTSYCRCMVTLFRCYVAKGEFEKAADFGEDALVVCKSINYTELLVPVYQELMIVYEELGRLESAFAVAKALMNLQKEMQEKKSDFNLMRLQSKMEIRQKDREIAWQKEMVRQKEEHNNTLELLNNELKNFVGMASHDMKEPARTIKAYSGILLKKIQADSTEYKYMEYINTASERMGILITDLLEYAHAGKYSKPPSMINMEKSCYVALNNMRGRIKETGAKVEVGELPDVLAHSTPIIQLFQNIMSNGIKYGRAEVIPEIKVYQIDDNEFHHIIIEDNGMGIPEDKWETIFEPFRRVHDNSFQKGSGIGLATCKKILGQYNGDIYVRSELGKGSKFHILFPVEQSAEDIMPK